MNWPQITWIVRMSLKLTFKAFRVFIKTERLSARAGTFLVHMVRVFLVAMLLQRGGSFSQARVTQPPQAALQYRDDMTHNARLEWELPASVADLAAQLHRESGWRPDAISPVGTRGLAQFISTTADRISQLMPGLNSRKPLNPAWAIRALVSYNRWLQQHVSAVGDRERIAMTLSGYNDGLGWI